MNKRRENIRNRFFSPGGCYIEGSMKNPDFLPISWFISETMQDIATVTMEDE